MESHLIQTLQSQETRLSVMESSFKTIDEKLDKAIDLLDNPTCGIQPRIIKLEEFKDNQVFLFRTMATTVLLGVLAVLGSAVKLILWH